MTQFNLSKEEITKLSSFISHSKDITTTSKYLFKVDTDTITIAMVGNAYSVRFKIGITDTTTDVPADKVNYFVGDIIGISNTLNKLVGSSDEVSVTVEPYGSGSKIEFKNLTTGYKISLNSYENLRDEEVTDILTRFEQDLKEKFQGDTYTLTPTVEFLDVMGIVCKSMNASGKEVNSACVRRNKIRYCDPQGILEYTLSDDVCPYDKDIYVQNVVVDYIKSYIKDGVTVTFDSTNKFVYIKSDLTSFVMVLCLEDNLFEYPTDDEINAIAPTADYEISISCNRTNLLESLETFDGVFRSDLWKWSNIELDSSKSMIDTNKISFSHSDYNASADTTVEVTLNHKTDPAEECKFLVGASYLKDLLGLMQDETITMSYSANPIGQAHGTFIIVEGAKLKAICVKILDSNA